jgi:hypothetical protein
MNQIDVSIIIVNWNAGQLLFDCLKSIIEHTHEISYEVIVIDNNSNPNTLNCLEELTNNDRINFIFLNENIGFSKANNLGAKVSKGEFILFLNPDTFIFDNSIAKLHKSYLEIAKTKRIGILVPELLNKDGSIQTSPQKFPIVTLKRVFVYLKKRIFSKPYSEMIRATEWARGACFFVPRTIGNSYGFWNEEFFLYGEDLEMCYRYKKYDFLTYIDPMIKVYHYYNQSGKQAFSDYQSIIKKEKGLELFYKIYKSKISFIIFELVMFLKGLFFYFKYRDKNRMKVSIEYIKNTIFK